MPAILFGSISTVADTSELQRQSFNQAFEASGLDWNWNVEEYRAMLETSGGSSRIRDYAQSRNETVDADAVHASKSKFFQENLASAPVTARPGVIDTIRAAKGQGWQLGLVTTTSTANVSALLEALSPDVRREDFDVIVDLTSVENPKPDKDAYVVALRHLAEAADQCVAIEDNADGIKSAVAAGVTCVAFPNENTATNDLDGAQLRVDHLNVIELRQLVNGK